MGGFILVENILPGRIFIMACFWKFAAVPTSSSDSALKAIHDEWKAANDAWSRNVGVRYTESGNVIMEAIGTEMLTNSGVFVN